MALICIQKCVFIPTWQNVIDNFARHSYTLRYSKDRKAMITLKASFCLHQPHRWHPPWHRAALGWCKTRFRLKQHEWSELAYRSKFLSQSWPTDFLISGSQTWKPTPGIFLMYLMFDWKFILWTCHVRFCWVVLIKHFWLKLEQPHWAHWWCSVSRVNHSKMTVFFSEHRIHLHRLVYHGLSILFLLK